MEKIIKNLLQDYAHVIRVYYDEDTYVGMVYLNESCVQASVLQVLNKKVNLVYIAAVAPNQYSICFRLSDEF